MSGIEGTAAESEGLELLSERDWILRLAHRLVSDASVAEDLTQETYLDALRFGWLRQGVSRGFLAGALRNKWRMRRRSEARRSRREAEVARDEVEHLRHDLVDQAEAHRNLVEHLLALREPYRVVLLERYFEGLSPQEIASREGAQVDSVRRRLSRAHAALRERLQASGGKQQWMSALAPLLRNTSMTAPLALTSALIMKILLSAAALGVSTLLLVLAWRSGDAPASTVNQGSIQADPSAMLAKTDSKDGSSARVLRAERSELGVPPVEGLGYAGFEGAIVDGQQSLPDDFELRVRDGGEGTWSARFDVEGQAILPKLPVQTDLHLSLWRGESLWLEDERVLRLESALPATRSWEIHQSCVVSGMAYRTGGEPGAGEELVIAKWTYHDREIARPVRPKRIVAECVSELDGSFVFPAVEPGKYMIGPRGSLFTESVNDQGQLRWLRKSNPVAPVLELFIVEPNVPTMETTLTLSNGLKIEGTIRYPDGSPASDVLLLATASGMGGSFRADSFDDGSFRFETLLPGEYSVFDNSGPEGWGLFSRPRVQAGTADLELVLEPAGVITGVVGNLETGFPPAGWLNILQDEKSSYPGSGVAIGISDDDAGDFRITSLEPSSYLLRFESSDHRWYGFTSGVLVSPGAQTNDLQVSVEEAAQLRFDLEDVTSSLRAYIYMQDGRLYARHTLKPGTDASNLILAVPPTKLRVSLRESTGAVLREVSLEMQAGTEGVLRCATDPGEADAAD